jgi:hypothetical protein
VVSWHKGNGNPRKRNGIEPVQIVRLLYIIFFEKVAIPKSGVDMRAISFMECAESREIEVIIMIVRDEDYIDGW